MGDSTDKYSVVPKLLRVLFPTRIRRACDGGRGIAQALGGPSDGVGAVCFRDMIFDIVNWHTNLTPIALNHSLFTQGFLPTTPMSARSSLP
jgi:hypothetical protein